MKDLVAVRTIKIAHFGIKAFIGIKNCLDVGYTQV